MAETLGSTTKASFRKVRRTGLEGFRFLGRLLRSGRAAEEHHRVFEKFYLGSKNPSERSGTGLGLAISREIVLHHKGEIWVDSKPGVGSTFYFTLPLQLLVQGSPVRTPEEREV